MGEIKGYLVKGTWRGEGGPCDVYAYWWTLFGPAGEVQWCDDRARATERGRLLFPTVNEADAARCKSSHLSDVSIYRVYADGREERLPDLEEALAEIERLRTAPLEGEDATAWGRMEETVGVLWNAYNLGDPSILTHAAADVLDAWHGCVVRKIIPPRLGGVYADGREEKLLEMTESRVT